MDYRPRHMPITHRDHDLYTTPYIEYAAEGLTGRTRVRRTAYAIIYSFERGIGLCGSQAFASESRIV